MASSAATYSDREFDAFLGAELSEEDRRRAHLTLLEKARLWWEARSPFRRERHEAVLQYRSRQFEETVELPGGEQVKAREYIERQGRMAVAMNLVQNVVNSVEGQFRQNASDRLAFAVGREDEGAARMINAARHAARRYNDADVLEADQFKEHILSGASGFKQSFEWAPRLNRHEVVEHDLDQFRLFYNLDLADRRMKGLRRIGELHDITLHDVIARFAPSEREAKALREEYGQRRQQPSGLATGYGMDQYRAQDFYAPADPGLCRVIEVWCPKYSWVRTGLDPLFEVIEEGYGEVSLPDNEIARIQNTRRERGLPLLELDAPRYEPHWHYYFLTPRGTPLDSGPTPFAHGGHPYTLSMAMLVDGETWGIVSAIKDPQRWLNRLFAHIDHAMGTGARGAVAYDADFVHGQGHSQADVDEWYTSAGGSLEVDVPQGKRLGDFVERFVAEKLPAGYAELIPTITTFIEKISGVTQAMQGFEPKSGTPAALYQQQIAQASANVLGYLESYFEGLMRKDRKQIQLLQQAISSPRTYAAQAAGGSVVVDPEIIRNVDFDVAIGSVSDTATYRMLWEDYLMQMMTQGIIPPEVYFEESSHPRAKSLLERLKAHQQEQLMQQVQLAQVTGELGGREPSGGQPSNSQPDEQEQQEQ